MHDADYDRKFHLQRVSEGDLIDRERPDRIQAERIRIAAEHLYFAARGIHQRVGIEVEHGDAAKVKVLAHAHSPGWAEHIDRLGEDVVVYEARVDAEDRHEQDDVASTEENLEHLVALEAHLESKIVYLFYWKYKFAIWISVNFNNNELLKFLR